MLTSFLYYLSVPTLFLVVCVAFLFIRKSKWKRASLYGLLAYGLFFFLGYYVILQSRSSTAAIGFIVLPIIALFPAGIGIVLGRFHTEYLLRKQNGTPRLVPKVGLIVLSLLLVWPFIGQLNTLVNTVSKNNSRDTESVRQREAIKNNTKNLNQLLSENPGREAEILAKKASETDDRTELIPIAENAYTSSATLHELSRSTDLGVALTVVRNRNTSVETLELIYKKHTYPSYFYVSLSSNPNTPEEILREIYAKRDQNTGITMQLARNPKLPEDILNDLINEPSRHVLQNILERPDVSCEQVNKVLITTKKLTGINIKWLKDKASAKAKLKGCVL